MQLPRSVHADQFQGKPAMERRVLSIDSSRLESRERNRAFLKIEISHVLRRVAWLTGIKARGP